MFEKSTDELRSALEQAVLKLSQCELPSNFIISIERLNEQISEPITLAVVGRVKAGKSSLVNAILGVELPTVDATEATATVNWFRFGNPDHSQLLRCFRKGESKGTLMPLSFLKDLQGFSESVLRRVAEIERLEFHLPIPWLKNVTLIDTPGLESAVDSHQNTTASFLNLASALRKRNIEATHVLASEADALLYVSSITAHDSDRQVLESFHRSIRGTADIFSSLTVVAKLDWKEQDPTKWESLLSKASKEINAFSGGFSYVSVALHRISERIANNTDFQRCFFQIVDIEDEFQFEEILKSREYFRTGNDIAPSIAERIALIDGEEWTAFATALQFARKQRFPLESGKPRSSIFDSLLTLSGVNDLRQKVLDDFVSLGPLLRALRIARDAELIIERELSQQIRKLQNQAAEKSNRATQFLKFIDRITPRLLLQDAETAQQLKKFIATESYDIGHIKVKAIMGEVLKSIAKTRRALENQLDRYAAMRSFELLEKELSLNVRDELKTLFSIRESGLTASQFGYLEERSAFWKNAYSSDFRLQRLFDFACREYTNLVNLTSADVSDNSKDP